MMIAVLIKINSIQEYIFQANSLKENIGASHITCEVLFHKRMKEVLIKLFTTEKVAFENWKEENPELILKNDNDDILCEIGEIGGGGALLFLKERENAEKFIKAFSLDILLNFPGLKTSFVSKSEFDFSNFRKELNELTGLAEKQKNEFHIRTTIPKKGIFKECSLSNQMEEVLYFLGERERRMISMSSRCKLTKAEDANNWYKKFLDNKSYTFSLTIGELWQDVDAGYIAVVYIDGNGMGRRFAAINNLKELRKISVLREKNTEKAFEKIFNTCLIKRIENKNLGIEYPGSETAKPVPLNLPIRPLLDGGDDVCFICEGRLGMHLAEEFIKYFSANHELMDGACAGVAIVKTKFPFYKAYKLAEELCKEAKVKSRNDNGSYISYLYSATTFAGSLLSIRDQKHFTVNGRLNFGPYNVKCNGLANSLFKLKKGIGHFQKESNISKNKVMQLREVILKDETSQKLFIKELAARKSSLPDNSELIWIEGECPFFDQIELMDFYPGKLL